MHEVKFVMRQLCDSSGIIVCAVLASSAIAVNAFPIPNGRAPVPNVRKVRSIGHFRNAVGTRTNLMCINNRSRLFHIFRSYQFSVIRWSMVRLRTADN